MNRGLRGFAVGVLSLTFLEVLVTSSNASGAVGGALTTVAGLAQRALDPTVAAIPNRANWSGSQSLEQKALGYLKYLPVNATSPAPTTTTPPPSVAPGGPVVWT